MSFKRIKSTTEITLTSEDYVSSVLTAIIRFENGQYNDIFLHRGTSGFTWKPSPSFLRELADTIENGLSTITEKV